MFSLIQIKERERWIYIKLENVLSCFSFLILTECFESLSDHKDVINSNSKKKEGNHRVSSRVEQSKHGAKSISKNHPHGHTDKKHFSFILDHLYSKVNCLKAMHSFYVLSAKLQEQRIINYCSLFVEEVRSKFEEMELSDKLVSSKLSNFTWEDQQQKARIFVGQNLIYSTWD